MGDICALPFNSDFTRFMKKDPNLNYSKKQLNELMLQAKPDIQNYIDGYNNCLLNQINYSNDDMAKFFDLTEKQNNEILTAEQVNLDTIQLYQNDYYYVITKGIVYLIVLAIFIYVFGISQLIDGIKTTSTVIKDTAIKVKDTAINLKDKMQTK